MRSLLILILPVISVNLLAQVDDLTLDSAKNSFNLSVSSNNPDAEVFADSIMIGKIPVENYVLEEGVYDISIKNISRSSKWNNENIHFNDFHLKSDTVIYANFNFFYFIRSNPYNASVFYQRHIREDSIGRSSKSDSLLGYTPLRYFSKDELMGSLILKKKGYNDYLFDLTSYNFETGADVTLVSKGKESLEEIVYKNRDTRFKTKRNFIPVVSFGAAALASAYGAIHFKNKANDAYDLYLSNPVLYQHELDNSNRNDVYSMVSLGLMQAALAGVIYYLFLD